mmetsp:Transcript_20724/g.57502  ORF Transcript_20724/g.57502 Transcript_20724/m.57502 type:complete len:467 (-) Transcript_20724:4-1404(-)
MSQLQRPATKEGPAVRSSSPGPPASSTSARPQSVPRKGLKQELADTTLFIRIRPIDSTGASAGHSMGEATLIKLEGWDESSVRITDSARKTHVFNYATRVLAPETTQQQAYDSTVPSLIDAWLNKKNNLMVLAYGQTGTGKTHTIFGPRESLASDTLHPDWGVLPHTMHACFAHIASTQGRSRCIVTASALEFYMGIAFDLLNDHTMIEVDPDGNANGHTMRVLENMHDFATFVEDMWTNRTTAATKMNSTSSRSHCCMLLTLFQMDIESKEYVVTKFNLIDLAGSERAAKTGGELVAGADLYKYMMMAYKGEVDQIPVGAQGQLINFELGALTQEIMNATQRYKQGTQYNPPKSCSSAFQRYTGAIMMGRTLLTTIVCLSPAPQNGLENLNSLRWGEGMSKLRAPNITEKAVHVETAHKAAVKFAAKTAKELEAAPQNRFWLGRKARADYAALTLKFLEQLMSSV